MRTKLTILTLIALVAIAFAFIYSNPGQNGPGSDDGVGWPWGPSDNGERVSQQLVNIFPQQIGYEWFYSGFAEYSHHMKLDNIYSSTDNPEVLVYEISGTVGDPSDGEASGDFGLELEYIITKDCITERILRGEKLPHMFHELQLLKLPLEPGAKWEQKIETGEKEVTLTAEILSIEAERSSFAVAGLFVEAENPIVYRVRYSVPMEGMSEGLYIEERTFVEGAGISYYERTLGEEYDFMFEYTAFTP